MIALIKSLLAPDGVVILFDVIPEERYVYKDYVLCRTWTEFTVAFADAGLEIGRAPQGPDVYIVHQSRAVTSDELSHQG